MADQKICGYKLADLTLCHELHDGCKHRQPAFSVCSGCGATASRECPQLEFMDNRCGSPLCESCVHQLDGSHGRREQEAFAPPPPPRREAPPELAAMRSVLTDVAEQGLTQAVGAGHITFTGKVSAREVAQALVDGISMFTAVQALSAISAAVPAPQERP